LGLEHPATGEWLEWHAPLPADLECVVAILRRGVKATEEDVGEGTR